MKFLLAIALLPLFSNSQVIADTTYFSDGTGGYIKVVNYKNSQTTITPTTSRMTDSLTSIRSLMKGYSVNVQALTSAPVDGQTIYFGILPKAPVTVAATSKIYIRKASTIKIAEIYCYSGTAGSAENWSIYIRKNNTTDVLISTIGVNTNERIFTNSGLNISMAVGDYFEIKCVNPTWATNPNTSIFGGYVYLE